MTTAAVIVAAGRGTRAGGALAKQWREIAGKTVAAHSILAFQSHPRIDHVLVVLHADDVARGNTLGCDWVLGGASRRDSVLCGLSALEGQGIRRVLIHDVARPGVSPAVIDAVLDALENADGAAPALPVVDALWVGDTGGQNTVAGTQPRDGLYRAQTPQGFDYAAILSAHRAHTDDAADDVAVARAAGITVAITQGAEDNFKITHPQDFSRAARLLENTMDIRLGNGFDVHAFETGDHVILCGVRIPHDKGLKGHSDADVGMHAITDAIYGALAEGDIGRHFPPSEAEWKGADSAIFLRHAVDLAQQKGFSIGNVDCTLICERPKIGPHAAAMQARLSDIMDLAMDRISVKATTSEQLGFTGRSEGIAALATATVVKS